MHPRDLVVRFLDSIGRPREAAAYLSLFQSEADSFAIIAVSDEVLRDEAGALVVDLQFLVRLGLAPAITVRSDPQRLQERVPELDVHGIDDDDALAELAATRGSKKLVFLEPRSGLQPRGRPVTSLVNITTEYDAVRNDLPAEQARLLDRIRGIMTAVPHNMTVAVTSPLDLLRELFTVRGAGTLIRRGATVHRFDHYAEGAAELLRELMETAFDRTLCADFFARPVQSIYVADGYRGAAITTATELGCSYLSKFAVDQRARGEGIGRDLWTVLTADHPQLLWRSRPDNPITPWYSDNCDGLVRHAHWHIFWRGLAAGDIAAAIDHAAAQPVDFEPKG